MKFDDGAHKSPSLDVRLFDGRAMLQGTSEHMAKVQNDVSGRMFVLTAASVTVSLGAKPDQAEGEC